MSRRPLHRLATLTLITCAAIGFVFTTGSDSNTWTSLPSLVSDRGGASATLVPDGRIVIAGGRIGGVVSNSVEALNVPTGSQPLAPMSVARADHAAAALDDGRILVMGGTQADGSATIFAELYSPSANTWSPVLMTAPRAHHTATKLDDGRVLVAGGDNAGVAVNTLEIFNPLTNTFMALPAVLPNGRTRHAAARLPDGRVLLAGGSDGAATLNSIVLVDPVSGTIEGGPALNTARLDFTATDLLNGDVLFAGGSDGTNDLASAERYIAATGAVELASGLQGGRRGHVALRLPENNGVLIAGGTASGQPLQSAEVFKPTSGFFVITEMTAFGHVSPAASSTATPGQAVLAGGDGTNAAELFHYATVKTDKDDYAPFTPVVVTGSGWVPGEIVTLHFVELPDIDNHQPIAVVADANGNITNSQFFPDWHDIGVTFFLTATGQESEALTTFKDNRTINFITLAAAATSVTFPAPGGTLSLGPGAVVSMTVNVTTDAPNSANWGSTSYAIATTAPNPATMPCQDHNDHATAGTFSETFNITAPTAPGTYNVYAIAYNQSSCELNPSVMLTATNAITVGNPAIAALKRALTNPTGAASVTWTATFNTAVTGVNVTDFAVVEADGVTGASVTSISGSGANYTVTVGSGTGNGTLGLNLVDDDTIVNGALPLGGAGAGNGDLTGEVYTIDKTVPTVTNVTSSTADGTYGTATVIPIQVTFTEPVVVTGTPRVLMETGTTDTQAPYASGSGTTVLTFNYTVVANNISADLSYQSTAALALNGGTIRDVATNNATLTLPAIGAAGSLSANKAIVIDTSAPTVLNVTSSVANGTYKVGDVLPILITFSEAVTVTGIPRITLETGTTDAVVDYTSGTGTTVLTFNYTVAPGQTSADLNYTATNALVLNGGTIRDALNNNATLTLPALANANSLGGGKNIVIEGLVPTVTNVTSSAANGNYISGAVIPVQVVFSEAVTVTGTPQLTLDTGANDAVVNYTSGSGTTTLTFTYTVVAGHITPDLNYAATTSLVLNGGTMKDTTGNDAILTLPATAAANSLAGNKAIVVDAVSASVTSVTSSNLNGSYGVNAVVSIQVVYTEMVTVTGTPLLTLETGTTDAIAPYTGGSGTNVLTFTYVVAAGHASADLDYVSATALSLNGGTMLDVALNPAALFLPPPGSPTALGGTKNIVIDGSVPTVTNVTSSLANGSYGAGTLIPIQVTFSEPVTVTGTPLMLLETGDLDTFVSYASGSGTATLTFNYIVNAGQATPDLSYASTTALQLNGGTIGDNANSATLTLPAVGAAGSLSANKDLLIETTPPAVSQVTSSTPNGGYGLGTVIPIAVTFSEAVVVTGVPQLTIETGTTDAVLNYTSGSGTATLTFAYTVATGHSTADLDYVSSGALALNGGTIKDPAGNIAILTLPAPAGAGSLGANKDLAIDGIVATVLDVTSTSADGTFITGNVLPIQVVFSEAVTVTGTPRLTLETGAVDGVLDYAGGSGTTTLVFNYTVAAVHSSADLDYTSVAALALNGGTINDAAGNPSALTLPAPGSADSLAGNKNLVIDAAPFVTNVSSTTANGTYGAGSNIAVTVTFSKVVDVTGTPLLTLETGATDAIATYVGGTGTATLTFGFTALAGHSSPDLDYGLTNALALNGGTIVDAVLNPAILTLPIPGAAGSLGANKNIAIDAVVPVVINVTSSSANGAFTAGSAPAIQVVFNKPVAVTGVPLLTLETGAVDAIATYTGGIGTATLTFTYVVGPGQNAADLDYVSTAALSLNGGTIIDTTPINPNTAILTLAPPGAAGSLGANKDLVIDTTPPTIVSIALADPSPTPASLVHWTVTFSESVTGVNTADFSLGSTGITGVPALVGISGSGNTYTVTATTGNGTGALGLNLLDDDSIADVVALKLGGLGLGNGSSVGQLYALDRTLTPTITASGKVYDGNTSATILTRSFTGLVEAGANVSLAGGTAVFDTKHVGTGKAVTATGLTLSGADAARYVLSSTSAATTADVTALGLTVAGVIASNKPYDATTVATLNVGGASLSGAIGGDPVTLVTTSAAGSFDTPEPGIGKTVTISGLTLGGASAGNYSVTQPVTTANITGAVVTPFIAAAGKAYDATTAVVLTNQGLLGVLPADVANVTLVIGAAAFDTASAGVGKPVTATGLSLSGSAAFKYALASPSAITTATITPLAITVTADAQTKVIGDPEPVFTYVVTSGALLAGDGFTGAPARAAGETVGTYAIGTGTLTAGVSYTQTFVGADLTITPMPGILELATSTNVRSLFTPAQLQSFLPERGRFTFPAPYGSLGVRLTNRFDCSEWFDCVNVPTGTSWRNMSNSTGSNHLYIALGLDRSNGGVGPSLFRYHKVTGETVNLGPLFDADDDRSWGSLDGWYFSPTQPTTLYVGLDTKLSRYDVLTKATTTVFDTANQFGDDKEVYHALTSNDDRVHSFTLRRINNQQLLGCGVYREDTTRFSFFPGVGKFIDCQIDKSGQWLLIKEDRDTDEEEDNRIVNLYTGAETVLLASGGAAGAFDNGFGGMVAADATSVLPGAIRRWLFGPLTPGPVVYHSLAGLPPSFTQITFANARSASLDQQYACGGAVNRTNGPRANEIVCVRLDGSLATLAIAPAMTDLDALGGGPDDDLIKQPWGNLDPTGQYFLWTSNLGTDRVDAFLVRIPPQALVTVPSDTTMPDVALSSPVDAATVSGTTTVNATASDNTGLAGVQLQIDGVNSGAELTAGPFSWNWDTTGISDGAHVLTAIARDNAGNLRTSLPLTVTVLNSPAAPVISNVTATGVIERLATVSWKTNQLADSQIQYGPTTAYGSTSVLDGSLVAVHLQTLTGLTPGTTYHYRVISKNAQAVSSASADFTFTTFGAPVISGIAVSALTINSATVSWTTNIASNTLVEYGLTTNYGDATNAGENFVTAHAQGLFNLEPGSIYHFRVYSVTPEGVLSISPDQTFTTIGWPVFSNIQVTPTRKTATIDWTTDQPATTIVEWGLTPAYGNTTGPNGSFFLTHSKTIAGLAPSTTYHYRLISANIYGLVSQSADFTFTTPDLPVVSAVIWKGLVNASVTNAVVTKAGGCAGCADAGAVSQQVISSDDGYVELTAVDTTSRVVGLTHANVGTGVDEAMFALFLHDLAGNGVAEVRESAVFRTQTSFTATDVLRIEITDGVVNYKKNGTTFYTSAVTPLYPLFADVALLGATSSVTNAFVLADAPVPTAPVLAGPFVSGLTGFAAGINWTTDHATTTLFEYGLTTAYGTTISSADFTSAHGVSLTGLTPGTTYHYRIQGTDVLGAPFSTGDLTVTAVAFPTLSNIGTSPLTNLSATIVWTTDQPTTSRVEYGLSSAYGVSTPLDPALVTSHSQTISGLNPGTTYHYRVTSTNSVGLTTTSGDLTFTTVAPPVISNVTASNVTGTAATIGWTTDHTTDTTVEYGLTTAYGSSASNPALVTSHVLTLSGLTPATTYHYRALSVDEFGQPAASGDATFTTVAVPVASNVTVSDRTETGATISWTTDHATTSQVDFGLTTAYGTTTTLDPALVTTHALALTGLTPGTTYHVRARSVNSVGLVVTTADSTFTTKLRPTLSNIAATGITGVAATIGWTTDQPTSSTVEFGTTTAYGTTLTSGTLVTSHSYALSGLTPGTTYHYRVTSTNVEDLSQSSADLTFTTTSVPVVSNVTASPTTSTSVVVAWTTDQATDTQVEFGLTTAYGLTTTLDATLATSHSQTLTGLSMSTTYHFRVRSTNTVGLTGTSADGTFTTPTGPAITGVTVSGLTNVAATIGWTTDQASTTRIEYGLTSGYGSSTTLDPALVTAHSQTLTGLTGGTVYHYRVISTNGSGVISVTADATFTTVGPPAITAISYVVLTGQMTWTTDQASDSRVDYGLTTAYGSVNTNAAVVTAHVVQLTFLNAGTTYHFKVTSTNAFGQTTVTWTSDQPATSRVDYGLTTAFGSSTTLDPTLVTAHSQTLTGLTPGTLYHFRVHSANADGLNKTSSPMTFTTVGVPVITNVAASGITDVAATITWTTDFAADSVVEYGLTTAYGSTVTVPALVTAHSIGLTGLTPGTTYHFRVTSTNAAGTTSSADATFDALGIPVVSNIAASAITGTSATITWTTSQTASSQVEYGLTTAYGSTTTLDPALVTAHSQGLTGLAVGTAYHYRVISTNATAQTATSDDQTFTTLAAPVISGITVSGLTGSAATIGWTTNQPATTQVEYGLTTDYGSTTTLDPALVTTHSQSISGLAIGTTYHYRVVSTNAIGLTSTSTDATFATIAPPVVSNIAYVIATASMSWTTNMPANSRVDWGLTSEYGSFATSAPFVTSHDVMLPGLTPGTTYHFKITSTNAVGLTTVTADGTFTSGVKAIMTNLTVASVTGTTATITWTTNEVANSQVEYGLTSAWGSLTTLDPAMVLEHTHVVTGLTPGTTYHFRALSVNGVGLVTRSLDMTFTTVPVPVISDVASSLQPDGSAVITWTTQVPANSVVEYGLTTSYGSTSTDPALVTSHSRTLTGLTPGTTYHFRAMSTNAAATASSADFTFTTSSAPLLSNITVSGNIGTQATITWTTSQPATSVVDYGLTSAYGTTSSSGTLVTSHSRTLTTLTPGTTYHFRVTSVNGGGEPGVSGNLTFTAAPPPVISGVTVSGLTNVAATIGWTTNQASSTRVEYGLTTSYGSTTTLDPALVTTHSQTVSGLTAATTYHYRVISTNSLGLTSASADGTFTTVAPPVISAINYVVASGQMTWTTDHASDSRVDYGLTTAYGSVNTNASMVTGHIVQLTTLNPGTTYHFKVTSTNAFGQTSVSADGTFSTGVAPTLTNITATAITANGATITWTSDQPSTSRVEYGLTTAYGSFTTLDPTLVTSHSQGLTGLAAGTQYHYRVISSNSDGVTRTSTNFTFTTSAAPGPQ